MEPNEFDEVFASVRYLAQTFTVVFEEVTGEELDIETSVIHYPLVALGLAAGAGALAGWWIGHKTRPALPPPQAHRPLEDFLSRLRRREVTGEQPPTPLEYIEMILPGGIEKVRRYLPDSTPEEASERAKAWIDDVLEPKLKHGLENAASKAPEGRFGSFLKQALDRWAQPGDGEEGPPVTP